MIILYVALILLTCLLVLLNVRGVWFVHDARRRRRLPLRGKATMFDVRYLLMEGEKDLAIQLYCEIFNTTFGKARKDIEQLERSLKV